MTSTTAGLSTWMRKRPTSSFVTAGHWRNRYFILDFAKGSLAEYSSEPDAREASVPVFYLELHKSMVVENLGEKMVRTSAITPARDKLYVLRISKGDTNLITLGSTTSETCAKWVAALQDVASKIDTIKPVPAATAATPSKHKSLLPDLWGEDHQWHMVEVQDGVTIEGEKEFTRDYPSIRCRATVASTPEKIFTLIMDDARRSLWDSSIASASVLRDLAPNSQIVYVQMRPIWVGPMCTDARDLVMLRYTRHDEDNQYVITWQSVEEPVLCPNKPGFVRGRVFAMGLTITPIDEGHCTVRFSCHADPGGSMSSMPQLVLQRWMLPFVSRVIGLQKVLANESAMASLLVEPHDTQIEESEPDQQESPTLRPAGAEVNALKLGTFPHHQWCETPQNERFNIRGKTYLEDGIKIKSGPFKFHLVAAELNLVSSPLRNCAARSDSPLRQIQAAYPGREVFVMQFMLPGPPFYSLPVYAVAKPGVLDDDSPFARLYQSFLDGTNDYRDSVFKMIPRVTKGAFVVKKTVGETPAIMGKKINLHYFRGPNYIEVDVDLGTSAIAGSILSVFKGYATTVTADMCLLLEGHSESELPEEILTSFRMIKPVLAEAKKLCPDPNPAETRRMLDLIESATKPHSLTRQGSDL